MIDMDQHGIAGSHPPAEVNGSELPSAPCFALKCRSLASRLETAVLSGHLGIMTKFSLHKRFLLTAGELLNRR